MPNTEAHIIYELRMQRGIYIGVTRKVGTVFSSVRNRVSKHYYRAKNENLNWSLCVAMRELDHWDKVEILVHEVVYGKNNAHKREVEIRRQIKPNLNTDIRGDQNETW